MRLGANKCVRKLSEGTKPEDAAGRLGCAVLWNFSGNFSSSSTHTHGDSKLLGGVDLPSCVCVRVFFPDFRRRRPITCECFLLTHRSDANDTDLRWIKKKRNLNSGGSGGEVFRRSNM